MKNLHFYTLALALCLPQSLLAWNSTGHEVVAAIAWDNMTPAARQAAIALLNSAPDNACLRALFSRDGRPQAVREREFFIRAATWPDIIRDGACSSFSHPSWHYDDQLWEGVSGGTGGNAPKDRTDLPTEEVNAVERLKLFASSACDPAAPCAPPQQATQLAWILHLVGDIHQPLHAEARVTSAHPTGDRGGNDFLLAPKAISPLHKFYDRILDNTVLQAAGENEFAYVDRVEALIAHDHPRPSMAGSLKPGDVQAWADEGFEMAKASAYPATLHEKQTPAPTYKKMVFAAADQAIALAGYRLADLLEGMLTGQTPPPPPPQPILHTGSLPAPSHIVIVIEENKNFGDVIGAPKAPYINELAGRGALLTSFFASHHPSQPNYIEFFAGDRLGVCKDECPIGPFTAQNLGAALIAAGKTFVGFAEDLPPSRARKACHKASFPLFAPKHCPWVDFSNIPAAASMDFSQFPQDPAGFAALPDVSFVIPNLKNDMHNGSVTATEVSHGDKWLKANMSNYADWAEKNNSLLIVTWDEDSVHADPPCPAGLTTTPPENRIPTLVMGEPVMAGTPSATTHTHADLLRTILDIYGIAPFGNATTATDITGIWK